MTVCFNREISISLGDSIIRAAGDEDSARLNELLAQGDPLYADDLGRAINGTVTYGDRTAIFIIPTFAIPIVALKPLDFPEIFEPTTSLGFAA